MAQNIEEDNEDKNYYDTVKANESTDQNIEEENVHKSFDDTAEAYEVPEEQSIEV